MQVRFERDERKLVTHLEGAWALKRGAPRFETLVEEEGAADGVSEITFETGELGDWDSSLLSFLMQGIRYCEEHDIEFDEESLPEDVRKLLDLARAVPESEAGEESKKQSFPEYLGVWSIRVYDGFMEFAVFLGQLTLGLWRLPARRTRFRWPDFWLSMYSNSIGALPIVTLIAFLVGSIIAFLGAVVLRQFGAGYYVSYLVGFGMLREMGAVMTGIIMTGRTGAAFAAELGTMKIMEELDAYKTLGLSPIEYLVLPRILGLFIMMPLLTVYATAIGILGGMMISVIMIDINVHQFTTGLLTPIGIGDMTLGIFKGMIFGLIIGISGCLRGMQTGSDAGAVGKAATSAVVTGITMIIFANAVIDWMAAAVDW
jgi:phospholipid/cholesterol/gamma-HCH transport system permease protein